MVKAIKRKDSSETKVEAPKKKLQDRNWGKIVILVTMALIVVGFTMNVPSFNSSQPEEQGYDTPTADYGVGFLTGPQEGEVGSSDGYKAIFGQLNSAQDTERRLDGDLYLLDNGLSQLILVNKTTEEIDAIANGNYIIYDVAFCDLFDCLVQGEVNGTNIYDIYELDIESEFLKTTMLGLPSI